MHYNRIEYCGMYLHVPFCTQVCHYCDFAKTARPGRAQQLSYIERLTNLTEQWVEKFARYYTPLMMAFAILIAIIPPLAGFGTWGAWFYQALFILYPLVWLLYIGNFRVAMIYC